MLHKFVSDTGSDWDQWLPHLLFAYKVVLQASTVISPFELLYGHEVKGPARSIWGGETTWTNHLPSCHPRATTFHSKLTACKPPQEVGWSTWEEGGSAHHSCGRGNGCGWPIPALISLHGTWSETSVSWKKSIKIRWKLYRIIKYFKCIQAARMVLYIFAMISGT